MELSAALDKMQIKLAETQLPAAKSQLQYFLLPKFNMVEYLVISSLVREVTIWLYIIQFNGATFSLKDNEIAT
jgi:hypothetical protein